MNFDEARYRASIILQIKTYEIDVAGHVNNIVYIKWLEELRNKIFEEIIPVSTLLELKLYPAVVSTKIVYKKQLKLSDEVEGFSWCKDFNHNILTIKFNFKKLGEICALAEQRCVLLNLENGEMDKAVLKSELSCEAIENIVF